MSSELQGKRKGAGLTDVWREDYAGVRLHRGWCAAAIILAVLAIFTACAGAGVGGLAFYGAVAGACAWKAVTDGVYPPVEDWSAVVGPADVLDEDDV